MSETADDVSGATSSAIRKGKTAAPQGSSAPRDSRVLLHAELCVKAVRWLKSTESKGGPGCSVAVSECKAGYDGEIPDAIGFRTADGPPSSVVVEVKVSRADFLADAQKPHRLDPELGMGQFRYFMAPAGMIALHELPPRWGLIEVDGRSLHVRAGHVMTPRCAGTGWRRDFSAWRFPSNRERELALLIRLLARIGDADALHRNLKIARNDLARMSRAYEKESARARKNDELLLLARAAGLVPWNEAELLALCEANALIREGDPYWNSGALPRDISRRAPADVGATHRKDNEDRR